MLRTPRAKLAIVSLALASCSTSHAGVRGTAPPGPVPAMPAPPKASAPPIERIAIDSPACEASTPVVLTKRWGDPLRLCDATNQHCFLQVGMFSGTFVAKTAKGEPASVLLEVPYGGMVLRGFITEPAQYPARPIVFGGFFIPDELDIKEGRDGGVLASAPLEAAIEPRKPLEQEIACGDIAWVGSRFEHKALVRLTKAVGEGEMLVLTDDTPLFDSGGQAVATIKRSWRGALSVHQTIAGRRLVVATLKKGTLFGWVPATALSRPTKSSLLGGSHRTRAPALRLRPDPSRGLRCKTDVMVLALVGGRRFDVGTIPANTWFSPGEDVDREQREILLRHPQLPIADGEFTIPERTVDPVDGARFAALKSSIIGCEPG